MSQATQIMPKIGPKISTRKVCLYRAERIKQFSFFKKGVKKIALIQNKGRKKGFQIRQNQNGIFKTILFGFSWFDLNINT